MVDIHTARRIPLSQETIEALIHIKKTQESRSIDQMEDLFLWDLEAHIAERRHMGVSENEG